MNKIILAITVLAVACVDEPTPPPSKLIEIPTYRELECIALCDTGGVNCTGDVYACRRDCELFLETNAYCVYDL